MILSPLDKLAIKIAIIVEQYMIMLVIAFKVPDEILVKIFKMNRDQLMYQLIGYNYLRSGNMQLPKEAEEVYKRGGKIILLFFIFGILMKLSDIGKEFIK